MLAAIVGSVEVVEFELRAAWSEAVLRQSHHLYRGGDQEDAEAVAASLAAALSEVTESLWRRWKEFRKRLKTRGVAFDEVAAVVSSASLAVQQCRAALGGLQQGAGADLASLSAARETLDRLAEEIRSVQARAQAGVDKAVDELAKGDSERFARAVKQMRAGEGEDVKDVLTRVQSGGQL
jgi:hypothetical protein